MKQEAVCDEERGFLTSLDELVSAGLLQNIPERAMEDIANVTERYAVRISLHLAELMDPENPYCPIRRQFLPDPAELEDLKGFTEDPLQDIDHQPVRGVTHRFRDRALIQVTPNCASACRFCFRKSLLQPDNRKIFGGPWDAALDYIDGRPEIREVILSGGDPLMASDDRISLILSDIARIPHVRALRIHTRIPGTLPDRITRQLASLLAASPRPLRIVSHFNHPAELAGESLEALSLLLHAGVRVLNQSVLLRGVNDNPQVLSDLFRRLFEAGVEPYYLHHPDPARGTDHFYLDTSAGLAIYRELEKMISRPLIPRYVIDIPGAPSKQDISTWRNGAARHGFRAVNGIKDKSCG